MIKDALKEFKNSRNKIYVILKYNTSISGFFAILTIVFGTLGFLTNDQPVLTGVLNSIKMFGLDFPSGPDELNVFMLLAIISAIITISLVAILFFVRESMDKYLTKRIFKKDHVAVFGLGAVTISFLNSVMQQGRKTRIAIVESDAENRELEKFRKNGFGVFIGDALDEKTLALLNFKTMQYAVIALGNDRVNIELAKKIINLYEAKQVESPIKLVVHIQNKDLETLFHQEFILPGGNQKMKIDVKTFSFFREVAEDLFENHSIDGDGDKFMKTDEPLNNILIGNGELLKNIIYQMALLSHFPNQNLHTVYVVDKEADKLLAEIRKYLYYQPDNFPFFQLEAVNIDSGTPEYFTHEIWKKEHVANVIIGYDTEAENLNLALDLFNRVYLSKAEGQPVPKVLFAIYDQLLLSEIVNSNSEAFGNFYAFGNSDRVLRYENLIEEEKDKLAKLINFGYGDEYKPGQLTFDEVKVNEKWYNAKKYSDKLSSIAQAKHIDVKLKAMGYKKTVSVKTKEQLQAYNRKMLNRVFDGERKQLGIGDAELKEYSKELNKFWAGESYEIKYFPVAYTSLFEKMIRMEHNRWNAYHFLNGWRYANTKNKDKKEHDCLKPLEDFKEDRLRITAIYDIYSFLYLPDFLAEAGYEMVQN